MWSLLLLACEAPTRTSAAPPPAPVVEQAAVLVAPPPVWPSEGAPLRAPAAAWAEGARLTVYVDGGHGAPGNDGMEAVDCAREGDLTLTYADALTERLRRSAHLDVTESRRDGALTYAQRIRAAERAEADLLLSLHVDSRAGPVPAVQSPTTGCWSQDQAEGFAVLWSDEGAAARVERRQTFARALAARLVEAGFTPYSGWVYSGIYDGDPEHPGVFVDRHAPRYRILMLRRPRVPSLIVETHHGLDPDEHARWSEPRTWDAFAAAIEAGLADVARLSPGPAHPGAPAARRPGPRP